MKTPIYLDYHATTPVDAEVLEEMIPVLKEDFGNPSNTTYEWGRVAGKHVEAARTRVANLIKAKPKEIVFTSGATEANNLAIKGVAEQYVDKGNHLITVTTEHKSVIEPMQYLEKKGFEVTYLTVDSEGLINLDELKQAITEKTILISVMFANNEIGVIQPIKEIGELAKEKNILFHVDAAQAVGKIPIDVEELNIDLLSLSGHKVYGPKGVGALWVRSQNPKVHLVAQSQGGGQEGGVRSGTMNVPSIVGLGKACEVAEKTLNKEANRITALRNRLWDKLNEGLEEILLNGSLSHRLPGNLNICFSGTENDALLMGLQEQIAVSSGSACDAAKLEPSYVLKALGLKNELANSAIRFGIGRYSTEEEIDYTAGKVIEVVKKLR